MSTTYLRQSKLSLLIPVCLFFVSCSNETRSPRPDEGFSSVADEQVFWSGWLKKHYDNKCPFRPFFGEANADSLKQVDQRLIAIDRLSSIFVLVIRTNNENANYDIVSLARNQGWQQIRWKGTGAEDLKEVIGETPATQEDILDTLSTKHVFVDESNWQICDADSVYVFLRYKGQCSRFAIYCPMLQPDAKAPDGTVTHSLKLLLWKLGIAKDATYLSESIKMLKAMGEKTKERTGAESH